MRSFIESFIDVGSGYILAIIIQLVIFPLFGLYPSVLDSMGIALILQRYQLPDRGYGEWHLRNIHERNQNKSIQHNKQAMGQFAH